MRAVTEFHQGKKLPPLRVVIVKGEDDLTIKVGLVLSWSSTFVIRSHFASRQTS